MPVLAEGTPSGRIGWADGLGRHSSDPQHRRCGVGCYTDTQERAWFPLPGIKQSVYRAEFLAVVRALEECQPHEVVSDCKGVAKAVQALLHSDVDTLKAETGTLKRWPFLPCSHHVDESTPKAGSCGSQQGYR
eukprot:2533210-Amphidinium_carterae.1